MKIYKIAKKQKQKDKQRLTPNERGRVKNRFGNDLGCSFFKDKDGYYCTTHRARSPSYETIEKIPKCKVEFVESTSSMSSKNTITKTASVTDQDIRNLKRDIKTLEGTVKTLVRDNKKLISDLNLGDRRFWQQKTVFTSVQRKLERFEKVEQEWKKFKSKMESEMKKLIEKKHRAQIG